MRATDIVRQVLDLLDQVEGQHDIEPGVIPNDDACGAEQGEPIAGRFKQIFAMLDQDSSIPGSNATTNPDEQYAGVDAVTTNAGGGVNGPKHVDDIRVKDPGAYQ